MAEPAFLGRSQAVAQREVRASSILWARLRGRAVGSKRRRLTAPGFAAALILVALTACTAQAPTPQYTLRIGLLRTLDDLPYFVMRQNGFDTRNGLHWVETAVQGGRAAIEAMAAGTIDVAPNVGNVPLLAAAAQGIIPGKAVAVAAAAFVDPDHPGTGILVGPSVRTWKDLEGQHIGVNSPVSISAAGLRGRLRQEGVGAYTLVELAFTNMGLAVSGGNIAAAAMVEPWLTQSLLRGDGRLFGWVVGGPPFERIPYTSTVVNAEFRRNNPEAVKAFLRAYLQAVRWIHDNPQKVPSILAKWLELSPEVSRTVRVWRWPPDARTDLALLESMQPVLIQSGLLDKVIPVGPLHDERLLSEVLAEKR
jgi:NitT/TauT family transport system substrate-binding protein